MYSAPDLQTTVIYTIDTVLIPDLPDSGGPRLPPPAPAQAPADTAGTPPAIDTQPSPADTKSAPVGVAVGATVGCLALLAVAAAVLIYLRKQRAMQQHAGINSGPKLWSQPGAAGAGSGSSHMVQLAQHAGPPGPMPAAPTAIKAADGVSRQLGAMLPAEAASQLASPPGVLSAKLPAEPVPVHRGSASNMQQRPM